MFIHSWRWFGPKERIRLDQIKQTGAEAIVSALHQIPVGELWPINEIRKRKALIENALLNWSVVESVPVHEDIKRRSGDFLNYIENYKTTLKNIGSEGIKTVCYNFMPVLDWSRTNLQYNFSDGSQSLKYDHVHFAVIDIYILKRKNAADSYSSDIQSKALDYYHKLSAEDLENLKNTFLLGFPGSGEMLSLDEVKSRIESYKDISKQDFRENLRDFLKEIVPVAEEAGIKLAIHPDDPPWPALGLPRIVSNNDDLDSILNVIDSPSNGITFCTGSFGSSSENDLPSMIKKFANRINFLHLRNVSRDIEKNFHENAFFNGDQDMYMLMKVMVEEDLRRMNLDDYQRIPLRPDHGQRILEDFNHEDYPGYPLYGRLKSLAEIRGLEIGIRRSMKE